MKRLFSVFISVLLLFSVAFTFGCKKEEKTFLVEFVLQCEVGNETVSVTVNGENSVVSKRYKEGKKLKEITDSLTNPQTTNSAYEFLEWVYVLDGQDNYINSNTVLSSSIAKDGKITVRPRCDRSFAGETYTISFQLQSTYYTWSRDFPDGIELPSYTEVNGSSTVADMVNIAEGTNLQSLLETVGTPVAVDKFGNEIDENNDEYGYVFDAWQYMKGSTLYEIDEGTVVSSSIANADGVITIVAVCLTTEVGPY